MENATLVYVVLGVALVLALVAIVSALALKVRIENIDEVARMRQQNYNEDQTKIWDRLWALMHGMEELGMEWQPQKEVRAKYVKRSNP